MVFIDAVTIIAAIALAGLGIFVGFGRTLEFFTKGIFGFIISVLFCAAFGGLIAGVAAFSVWTVVAFAALAGLLYMLLRKGYVPQEGRRLSDRAVTAL